VNNGQNAAFSGELRPPYVPVPCLPDGSGDQPADDPQLSVDLHVDERLHAREAGDLRKQLQASVAEPQ
jgi:hypothetical protein